MSSFVKTALIGAVLLVACEATAPARLGGARLAANTITVNRNKNDSYQQPPTPAGDGGHLLRVDLDAPGQISSVKFSCEGKSCGWVHECPDGGACGGSYPNAVEYRGTKATWFGWSNSGDNCVLIFTIDYQ